MAIKSIIKKILPERLVSIYHLCLSYFAAFYYGFPSQNLLIIGITGTKGKTSTANFIWSALTEGGFKTGMISTANIKIGREEKLNHFHMTMPGRFIIQRLLFQMVQAGCQVCIVETTSEGIKQWRHKGIIYDYLVFTNLTPEHLPSHGGSFEKYREAKSRIFAVLQQSPRKTIAGQEIKKIIIANQDDEHKDFFLGFGADQKITYGFDLDADYIAQDAKSGSQGVDFKVNSLKFHLNILGNFNISNALPAIIIGDLIGLSSLAIQQGLENVDVIPGRMEQIKAGQNFTVLVDYAHEPKSIAAVLATAQELIKKGDKIIILLGAEGGGRDKAKRPKMGQLAAEQADDVVVSNVDPYDDDPLPIIEDIAQAAEAAGKKRGQDLFCIEDRREGIKKALSLANKGDVVLITGKGAEQSMIIKGKSIPWDDRKVVEEEIEKIKNI